MEARGAPVASLQQALAREGVQIIVYGGQPTPAAQAALQRQETATDGAVASFSAAAGSASVMQSASAGSEKAIAALRESLASLRGLRANIADRSIGGEQGLTDCRDPIPATAHDR